MSSPLTPTPTLLPAGSVRWGRSSFPLAAMRDSGSPQAGLVASADDNGAWTEQSWTHSEPKNAGGETMTTVSASRTTHGRRRVHAAVGTATAAIVATVTFGVDTQLIPANPPASDLAPSCSVRTSAHSPLRIRLSHMVLSRSPHTDPRHGISQCRPSQLPVHTPAAPSDPTGVGSQSTSPVDDVT
jgi:hypothetical protein